MSEDNTSGAKKIELTKTVLNEYNNNIHVTQSTYYEDGSLLCMDIPINKEYFILFARDLIEQSSTPS